MWCPITFACTLVMFGKYAVLVQTVIGTLFFFLFYFFLGGVGAGAVVYSILMRGLA